MFSLRIMKNYSNHGTLIWFRVFYLNKSHKKFTLKEPNQRARMPKCISYESIS